MEHKFPTWCLVISMLFMFVVSLGATNNIIETIVRLILVWTVLCIPVIIAKARDVRKQEFVIQWALLLWFIPFSWIVAMSIALFGETKQREKSVKKNYTKTIGNTHVATHNNKTTYDYKYPENAIDKTVYKIGHATTNVVTTVRDSKVVRGTISVFFKLLLLVLILFCVGMLVVISQKTQQTRYRNVTRNVNSEIQYNQHVQQRQQQRIINNKMLEQKWFEQAATSMK